MNKWKNLKILIHFWQRLTIDHCASDPQELQRILEAGGEVTQDEFGSYRVNRFVNSTL